MGLTDVAVAMTDDPYPGPSVLLTRLLQGRRNVILQHKEFSVAEIAAFAAGRSPSEELLRDLAEAIGMRSEDLCLVAGLPVPGDPAGLDRKAGRELPRLVRPALSLSSSGRQRLREFARSLPEVPRTATPEPLPRERYPPGFGSLLVRMLALRNLGWTSAAVVMALMSGVYLSATTIGAVGRGVKELDAELLNGFAPYSVFPSRSWAT